ncbi:family 10 glycosylhydrolase [Salicibibacter cibarius]|nr:family 10 glycosylhydrolase [Salicibibacter cibarius]
MKIVLAMLLSLVFVVTSFTFENVSSVDAVESEQDFYRSFWVHAFEPGLKTEDEIDQLIMDVKDANMNSIIAQVSRRHDAYYHSDVLPFTEDTAVPEGFDSLGYLIDKAEEHGIEVHAWINVGTMWQGEAPENPEHIYNKYGPDAPDDETWVTKGYEDDVDAAQPYLDLGHPEARDHVVDIVRDVVKNYDVDGVHLDYIRYPENPEGEPIGWNGYNPTSLERFQEETGRTDRPHPEDEEWLDWKVEQTDSLVKRVYTEMMDENPEVDLSTAVVSWGLDDPRETDWWDLDPVQRVHQNWKEWVQEGYLDYVYVMNYDEDADPERADRYDAWIEWQKDLDRNRGMVIGPGLYLNTVADGISQINRAMKPSPSENIAEGVSPYVYNDWSNDDVSQEDLIRSLSQPTEYNEEEAPFSEPVDTPTAEWKDNGKGHVLGQLLVDGEIQVNQDITLKKGRDEPAEVEVSTDANGYFAVTDLKPGNYFIEINGKDADENVQVTPNEVSRIDMGEEPEVEPPESAADIEAVVEGLAEDGAFADDETHRALTVHLTAVHHYENQGSEEQAVQHMEGFEDLLDHQQEEALITEEAYDILSLQVEELLDIRA